VDERVLAVVATSAEAPAAAGQDRPPDAIRRVARAVDASAWDTDAAWLWLLDGGAIPRPDALRRLLAAAAGAGGLPAPVLLASKVVDESGAVAPGHTPWYRRGGSTDVAMSAAQQRLLPVCAAAAGSLLVRREAALSVAPPRLALGTHGAALEWTARLLRDAAGFYVPASVAVAIAPDGDAAAEARAAAAMLLDGGWTAKDRWRLGADALARARAAVGAGRSRPARLLGAAAEGALKARGAGAGRPEGLGRPS
jgi:hypothetical protein